MDCIVHGVAKSQTRLNNFHFTSLFSSPHFLFLFSYLLPASLALPSSLCIYFSHQKDYMSECTTPGF